MNPIFGTRMLLLLMMLSATGCASTPEPVDPYNPADSQRSRAQQAQDELSSEIAKEE